MGNCGSNSNNAASSAGTAAPKTFTTSNNDNTSNAAPTAVVAVLAPPGYQMPGARNQKFYVTIPYHVRPGQRFGVRVNGQQMMVQCPMNKRPGERIIVTGPWPVYFVTIPANVEPGQQFRVMMNNQEVMVTCPRDVRPGQQISFQQPDPTEKPPQAAPNHQMPAVIQVVEPVYIEPIDGQPVQYTIGTASPAPVTAEQQKELQLQQQNVIPVDPSAVATTDVVVSSEPQEVV